MNTYVVNWKHDVTEEILTTTVEATNVTFGALKTITAFEKTGHNIDCWKALNCIK